MKLVTYPGGTTPRLGAVGHDHILDLRALWRDPAGQRVGSARRARPGTPAGVGAATGRLLEPGDAVEAEVDGVGCLVTAGVAPEAP